MANMKVRNIKTALLKKGFVESPYRDHHFYTFFYQGTKTSIRTKISHGETDIDDGLISAMAKQVHLNKPDFAQLVECPLSEEEYIIRLIEKGSI